MTKDSLEAYQLLGRKDQRLDLKYPAWNVGAYNYYFFPNPLMTKISLRNSRFPVQRMWHDENHPSQIFFCFVDIDFKNNLQSEIDELIASSPVQPNVIVHSGNGYHLYFRVKTVDLLARTEEYQQLLSSYDETTALLYKYFKGDLNRPRKLRVPGTYNFKINPSGEPLVSLCREIRGSLLESYHREPDFTMEQLALAFGGPKRQSAKKTLPIYYEPRPENAPKPDVDGLKEAKTNFLKFFELDKLSPLENKYFDYIYGYRNLLHYFERRGEDRNFLGANGKSLKRVRTFFLDRLQVIQIKTKGNRMKRRATAYAVSEKFWKAIGHENSRVSPKRLAEDFQSTPYPQGQRKKGVERDIGMLLSSGIDHEQIRFMIKAKAVLGRSGNETREIERHIAWCLRRFSHLHK